MRIGIVYGIALALFLPSFFLPTSFFNLSIGVVHAQVGGNPPGGVVGGTPPGGVVGGNPTQSSGASGGAFSIKNPLKAKTISDFLKDLFRAAVKVGLPIVVLFIVYAGFMFVKARGNAEELTVAKRNFIWVVFGTTIFLGAWAIAEIIAATLRQLGV